MDIEKTITRMGGSKLSLSHFDYANNGGRQPKFKQGDTVRVISDENRPEMVNTLAVIYDVSNTQNIPQYALVSLEGHGRYSWFDEIDLKLVLAVEDLVKVANNNMV